ncbi:uncharacterized protein EV154DRAFT_571145 [Mucor mucedo]|uniref:uncharacterized protein n=1 Tax=Mucor mucedo TaxID=29922 RepID=UPI00221F1BB0|nr:uncharacterized protein EV154DRAFT_571145 [Mucor mucedo]KAI7869427.1 hypothetical protein EV154DRAFT_571145 [Mucor mucedo]
MASTSASLEQTVLDNHPMPTNWSANKPKIIEFYGFEGEDFRYFRSVLETFFSLTGITQDLRRVNVLRTQLRRSAGVFFDKYLEKHDLTVGKISYKEAIQLLQEHYITEQIIQNYELAFNEMQQSPGESPQVFLSRLYEAADLADIQEEKLIHSRFRAGLLPALKTFCREQSASSFDQWVKHADGWWNAHAPTSINLVENPFVSTPNYSYSTGILQSNKSENEKSVRFLNDRVSTLKNIDGKTHKSNTKAYASEESPTMTALTAKLEALDLHQLIPLIDSNETTHENIKQSMTESWKTDKGLKTFIKNIVQEVVENDVKEDAHNNYSDNKRYHSKKPYRRNSYQKDDYYFDNDAASPAEGYYLSRRQYEQQQQDNRPLNNYNNGYNYNRNSYNQSGRQPSYNSSGSYNYNDNAHQSQSTGKYNSQPYNGYQNSHGPSSNQNAYQYYNDCFDFARSAGRSNRHVSIL